MKEPLENGAAFFFRLAIMVMASFMLIWTTDIRELMVGLVRLGMPYRLRLSSSWHCAFCRLFNRKWMRSSQRMPSVARPPNPRSATVFTSGNATCLRSLSMGCEKLKTPPLQSNHAGLVPILIAPTSKTFGGLLRHHSRGGFPAFWGGPYLAGTFQVYLSTYPQNTE